MAVTTCLYFTMKLADGWMDRTDARQTDRWIDVQVESHLG